MGLKSEGERESERERERERKREREKGVCEWWSEIEKERNEGNR